MCADIAGPSLDAPNVCTVQTTNDGSRTLTQEVIMEKHEGEGPMGMYVCDNCFRKAFKDMLESMKDMGYQEAHFEGTMLGIISFTLCRVLSCRRMTPEQITAFCHAVISMTEQLHNYDYTKEIGMEEILRMTGCIPQEELVDVEPGETRH